MNFSPYWGPQWGPPAQPVVFIPSPTTVGSPTTTPQVNSWEEAYKIAKQKRKEERKMQKRWLAEQEAEKKKKSGEKKDEPKKPMVPLMEGLFLTALLSPFIGLPMLKIYQMIFNMWGTALGVK